MAHSFTAVCVHDVSIGQSDGTHYEDIETGRPSVTLWAYTDYGDLPAFLTPEQAIEVGEALIRCAQDQIQKEAQAKKRYALISLHGTSGEQIARYLPANYEKIGFAPHDPEADGDNPQRFGPCVVIQGEDNAGWTLDDYVLPRLASGLIVGREIDSSHPVLKSIEKEAQG